MSMKKFIDISEIEPATFRLVAQFLNQLRYLRHCVSLFSGYRVFFPRIKRLGSGAVVKNEWSCSSSMPSWRGHEQLYLLPAVSKNVSHIFKLIEYFVGKYSYELLILFVVCDLK
jgi:hypothetical protein